MTYLHILNAESGRNCATPRSVTAKENSYRHRVNNTQKVNLKKELIECYFVCTNNKRAQPMNLKGDQIDFSELVKLLINKIERHC